MLALTCPKCGGKLEKKYDGGKRKLFASKTFSSYVCSFCDTEFEKDVIDTTVADLAKLLDEQKQERIANLKASLWKEIVKPYADSLRMLELSREIMKYDPNDFLACFFEVANIGSDYEIVNFIQNIDVHKNYYYVTVVLDFMLKSFKPIYSLVLSDLVDRAFYNDQTKKDYYYKKLSQETLKAEAGVYNLDLPRDVFIIYSSEDIGIVNKVTAYLEENGISCFVAARNLSKGRGAVQNYEAALYRAIDHCYTILFISSRSSRDSNRDTLRYELPYVRKKDIDYCTISAYKNDYLRMPLTYKKPRIEFLIEDYAGTLSEKIVKEFFAGCQWCKLTSDESESLKALGERIIRIKNYRWENVVSEQKTDVIEDASVVKSDDIDEAERLRLELQAEKEKRERIEREIEEKRKEEEAAELRRRIEKEKQKAEAKKKELEEKQRIEEEARKQAEETAKRLKEEEAKRNAEAAKKAEEKRKEIEELERKLKATQEENERLIKEQEEKKRKAAEEAKKKAELAKQEEERKAAIKKQEEERKAELERQEAKRKELERKLAEAEAQKKAIESKATGQPAYKREGNYIYFGTYPQTKVTDSTIISALNKEAGKLPNSSNTQKWTSYKYYIKGKNNTDFMWYIDVENSGNTYRGVYFTSYRPFWITESSSASNSYQDEYGYYTSTVYWFKYEPIKWRILNESNGEALIFSEMAIDSQEYYPSDSTSSFSHNGGTGYANNYELSNIRKWLNDTFYNTAFTSLQKALIIQTTVDNSERSTNPDDNATQVKSGNNGYACSNTQDYVFLLSVQEVTTSSYGFDSDYNAFDTAREKKVTDYAKCQGADRSIGSSYSGNGFWWLRSPDCDDSSSASFVDYCGSPNVCIWVYSAGDGVVPALKIRLD